MLALILAVVVALVVVLAVLAGLFLLGMRSKSRWVQVPIIWISRALINPRQMRTAGGHGAYASVIRHRGRASGRAYETPVGVIEEEDGYLIALPYGLRSQWLRNVLAGGGATLVHEGAVVPVDRPELVAMTEVEHHFSPADQRSHRLFRVDECLRLWRAEPS